MNKRPEGVGGPREGAPSGIIIYKFFGSGNKKLLQISINNIISFCKNLEQKSEGVGGPREGAPSDIPIYPFTHLPIYPFTHLPIYPFTHLPIYPFTHLPIYPFTHLPIYPFTHLPINPFTLLPLCMSERGGGPGGDPFRHSLFPHPILQFSNSSILVGWLID